LQVVAEELRRSLKLIFAAAIEDDPGGGATGRRREEKIYATQLLLLIADSRFCRVVVDKVPAFSFACFLLAQDNLDHRFSIFQFARNIGQEFIRNTSSAFYQEESGYYSGIVGYAKPATRIIFGSYAFIEKCASEGASPIETDYREFNTFTAQQLEGYGRAALAFLEGCLAVTRGRPYPHSYALARMFNSLEEPLNGVPKLDKIEHFYGMVEYDRLGVIVQFVNDAIELVDKSALPPSTFRVHENFEADIYDDIAELIFEIILRAASVTSPPWTAWAVQHNAVWGDIFGIQKSAARKVIAMKVRRLCYDEIKRMDEFPNFKGARILGFCLHVLGLTLTNRHDGHAREFYSLQAAVLYWTKTNYTRLVLHHPKVAAACLHGSISYDRKNSRLVQTYENEIGEGAREIYLPLD
jgi:hypothetical protein